MIDYSHREYNFISPDRPSVGVLIVTLNRKDDLLECIGSVFATGYPRMIVYVVDNASTDGTLEAVKAKFPDVRMIRSEENLGFAGGNNLGLSWVIEDGMDAVFLVNDDVVISKDSIEMLVRSTFSKPDVGITAPKVVLHSDPSIIWSAGGLIDPDSGIATQRFYGEVDLQQADDVTEIDYAVGCAMLVKTAAICHVGLLDSRFFTYYEEADWCRRIREIGYRILYVPKSKVSHKVTLQSNGRNQASYYYARNRLLYLQCAGLSKIKIAGIAILDLLRSATVHAAKGRRHQSRLIAKGVADYYTNTFGKLRSQQ